MKCVESIQTTEEIIKKSRFIGVIVPCDNESAIVKALTHCQAQYPTANHIAFAYRVKTAAGIVYRCYDAGEPGGTAGRPIFQHLEGNDLINTLIAVVRFFGGIKLGAGGLARAYGNAARQVIEASKIVPFVEYQCVTLKLDYSQLKPLEYQLGQLKGNIIEQQFAEQVEVTVRLPAAHVETLTAYFLNQK